MPNARFKEMGRGLFMIRADHAVFARVFRSELEARGLTPSRLAQHSGTPSRRTLSDWVSGRVTPRGTSSLRFLKRLAEDWDLPPDRFTDLLDRVDRLRARGEEGPGLARIPPDLLRWHLPDDFVQRSPEERAEIEDWLVVNLVDYQPEHGRYLRRSLRTVHGFDLERQVDLTALPGGDDPRFSGVGRRPRSPSSALKPTPEGLAMEWRALVHFKTTLFTPPGLRRDSVWGAFTVRQRAGLLGRLMGALVRLDPGGGLAPIEPEDLSLGLLVFPAVWDQQLRRLGEARGFVAATEISLLSVAAGLTRPRTGWLTQSPELGERLKAIPGLVTEAMIVEARDDWPKACADCFAYAASRTRDLRRQAARGRDPLHPIAVVLDDDQPLAVYRRIPAEMLAHLPDRSDDPDDWAEGLTVYLMMRLALHTGLRQGTLRRLLWRPDQPPLSLARLSHLRRGELRWDPDRSTWALLIPASAFKNAASSFFWQGPYRTDLPDVEGLHQRLEAYVTEARVRRWQKGTGSSALFLSAKGVEYTQAGLYGTWRRAVARHGVYNPWTGRGAIRGLLPHGPHAVRAVLATHLLKRTHSLEIAGYAIQDLPDTVQRHYGRFLPSDKARLVNGILDEVWSGPPLDSVHAGTRDRPSGPDR